MNKLYTRWLPCLTMALWSAITLFYSISGKMSTLLAPQFRVYASIAGVLLAILAVVFAVFPADAGCCSAAECGHSLSRWRSGRIVTFLILMLPISAAALVNPGEFSASFVRNKNMGEDADSLKRMGIRSPKASGDMPTATLDTADTMPLIPANLEPEPNAPAASGAPATTVASGTTSAPPAPDPNAAVVQPQDAPKDVTDYLTRTPEGNIVVEVPDLLYAAQDSTLRKDFEGKRVELIGQFMPDKAGNQPDKRFKAVRMYMTCCAADARPVATVVEMAKFPDLPEMTWVKIVGVPSFPIENGRRAAVLMADKVEKTNAPEDAMIQ